MRILTLTLLAACGGVDTLATLELPNEDLAPTGVAVAANGDVLLSSDQGLWRYDGAWSPFLSADRIAEVGFGTDVTDLAALPDGTVALTVPGVGLLFDPAEDTLVQHFCYEPGWGDWEISEQKTHSLTYDSRRDLLVAQPQTTTDGEADRTDVADFHPGSGEPLDWHPLEDATFVAQGMAVQERGFVLAEGRSLYRWALGEDMPKRYARVEGTGPIQGLAADGDDLRVLDADGIHTVR